MRRLLLLPLLIVATNILSNDEGKELHDESCISCHDSQTYTKFDSSIESHFDLRRQVSFCSVNLSTGWFPEEEESVISFLNFTYYNFTD